MTREQLKELGLDDTQIDSVMKVYGKSVNDYKEKAEKVDVLNSQIDDYKQQLTDRDNQLQELKKVDAEGLQAEIDRLTEENKTTANDYQEKLNKQAKDFAIETTLRNEKARNPKIAKNALDFEAITYKDGNLIGLEEQIKAIKESDPYLFEEDLPKGLKGKQPNDSNTKQGASITRDELNAMSYKERVDFKNENEELYNKLLKGE